MLKHMEWYVGMQEGEAIYRDFMPIDISGLAEGLFPTRNKS